MVGDVSLRSQCQSVQHPSALPTSAATRFFLISRCTRRAWQKRPFKRFREILFASWLIAKGGSAGAA